MVAAFSSILRACACTCNVYMYNILESSIYVLYCGAAYHGSTVRRGTQDGKLFDPHAHKGAPEKIHRNLALLCAHELIGIGWNSSR